MLNPNRRDLLKSLVPAPATLGAPGAAAKDLSPAVRNTVYAWYPARMGTWETSAIEWEAITHISYRSVVLHAEESAGYLTSHPEKAVQNLLAYVRERHIDGLAYDDEQWNPETAGAMTRFPPDAREDFQRGRSELPHRRGSPPVISSNDLRRQSRKALQAWAYGFSTVRSMQRVCGPCCGPPSRRRTKNETKRQNMAKRGQEWTATMDGTAVRF